MQHPKAFININAEIKQVMHANLKSCSEDSDYRKVCSACEIGVLLVARHNTTYQLRRLDRCTLCGQAYWYVDEKIGEELFHPEDRTVPELKKRDVKIVRKDTADVQPWLDEALDELSSMYGEAVGGVSWEVWQEDGNPMWYASVYPTPVEIDGEPQTPDKVWLNATCVVFHNHIFDEAPEMVFALVADGPSLTLKGLIKGNQTCIFLFVHAMPGSEPVTRLDPETGEFIDIPEDEIDAIVDDDDDDNLVN